MNSWIDFCIYVFVAAVIMLCPLVGVPLLWLVDKYIG